MNRVRGRRAAPQIVCASAASFMPRLPPAVRRHELRRDDAQLVPNNGRGLSTSEYVGGIYNPSWHFDAACRNTRPARGGEVLSFVTPIKRHANQGEDMPYVIKMALLVVSIIHLLPLVGVLSNERLTALYGIPFKEPNLEIVMRHRAVLFGLLGAFLLYAAFQPAVQLIAFIAGFVSVASFLWLAWSVGNYNAQIGRVFTADLIALVCLAIGFGAYVVQARQA